MSEFRILHVMLLRVLLKYIYFFHIDIFFENNVYFIFYVEYRTKMLAHFRRIPRENIYRRNVSFRRVFVDPQCFALKLFILELYDDVRK